MAGADQDAGRNFPESEQRALQAQVQPRDDEHVSEYQEYIHVRRLLRTVQGSASHCDWDNPPVGLFPALRKVKNLLKRQFRRQEC